MEVQETKTNLPALSVSEISTALKRTVEGAFSYVRVRGEISRPKRAPSGHVYLTLKDDKAVLDGVCWRGMADRLSIQPEEGLEVICTGKLTTYAGRSSYQMVIETMELAGQGGLLKMLEERKKKLAAEGLFDQARKKPLPFIPQRIGVVTSPTGAVIRDILHRLADRFPRHVLVWPVLVQGEKAAAQITAAINGFNALPDQQRPDLLIVARGGGSLEDLMPFNEENVVRAAAASTIPLISAVGHETDTTLIDYASDRRAPTPTAAAEISVPERSKLIEQMSNSNAHLTAALSGFLEKRKLRLDALHRGLTHPRSLIENYAQRLDDRVERLSRSLTGLLSLRQTSLAMAGKNLDLTMRHYLKSEQTQISQRQDYLTQLDRRAQSALKNRITMAEQKLQGQTRLLEGLSYKRILDRGFALAKSLDGKAITKTSHIPNNKPFSLTFADGSVAVHRIKGDDKQDSLL